MGSYHFYDRMEREVDLFHEYEKFEWAICYDSIKGVGTLNEIFDKFFLRWPFRQNYMSMDELRDALGFSIQWDTLGFMRDITRNTIDIFDFLTYCELIGSLYHTFNSDITIEAKMKIKGIIDTMKYDLNKLGYAFHMLNDNRVIILQNDKSLAVLDYVKPEVADAILEYNHYVLKGNLDYKRQLLKVITDDLEPKRGTIKGLNKSLDNDFFYLVNNMNVRHNNCDPSDCSTYCEAFDKLNSEEKESWYDDIYQLGVLCYMIIENASRKQKINNFKNR